MSECCVKYKKTPRAKEEKTKLVHRINRIAGQMNGIKSMIEEDRYCEDVLIQLAAVEKSVKSLATEILQEHVHTCMVENIRSGNVDVVDEIVELFRRF